MLTTKKLLFHCSVFFPKEEWQSTLSNALYQLFTYRIKELLPDLRQITFNGFINYDEGLQRVAIRN